LLRKEESKGVGPSFKLDRGGPIRAPKGREKLIYNLILLYLLESKQNKQRNKEYINHPNLLNKSIQSNSPFGSYSYQKAICLTARGFGCKAGGSRAYSPTPVA
jgi:hypothetical protein